MELLKPKPTAKGPAERFAGDAWVEMIAEGVEPSRLRIGLVHFAPRARTAWHRHTAGQTLHVVSGVGLVATRDGQVIVMRPGDTVHTPPGEWHWHGATPEAFMAHLAMSEAGEDPHNPDVDWAEHVTDDEYQQAASSR